MENNIYYKMMINNAKQYLKNTDPNATIKSTDDKPLNAFDISNVLSIVTGKLKEDIIIDLIKGIE